MTLCNLCSSILECNIALWPPQLCRLACTHHWLLGEPHYEWGTLNGIDLYEVTEMTCKRCGEKKTNRLLIPPEADHDFRQQWEDDD